VEAIEKIVVSQVPANKPAVSVIIPNYNTARFISETLDSVFEQSFKDFEVIVINDGAPDTAELCKVLEEYKDKIIFLDKAQNDGTAFSRNLAAIHARADVLAFLDADDIWQSSFLDELYAFMADDEYDMVYTDAEVFGIRHMARKNFMSYNPEQGPVTRTMLIEGRCHILPSGALIKKTAFNAVGGFDPEVKRTEDFDLWMRLLFNGVRIGYLRKLLFKFRLRPDSGSGDFLIRMQRCIDVWEILRKKLDFTAGENLIIDRHIAVQQSGLLRARGRYYLSQRDWTSALSAFREARLMAEKLSLPWKHRLKLAIVINALRISPNLVLRIFQKLRPQEFEYIATMN